VAVKRPIRSGYLAAWLLLIVAVITPTLLRIDFGEAGPTVTIVVLDGNARTVSLEEMKRLPTVSRRGTCQNQYGNWRDEGTYTGVRLADLVGADVDYEAIRVIARDGYEVLIMRSRIEDLAYPVVLAYAFDGTEVPGWADGFRIAVLPEDGNVGNEEYGVDSAGSYWVKNVERIILQ